MNTRLSRRDGVWLDAEGIKTTTKSSIAAAALRHSSRRAIRFMEDRSLLQMRSHDLLGAQRRELVPTQIVLEDPDTRVWTEVDDDVLDAITIEIRQNDVPRLRGMEESPTREVVVDPNPVTGSEVQDEIRDARSI
jgi:hypothetical protein